MSWFGEWLLTGPQRAWTGAQAALVRKPSWNRRFWTLVIAIKGGAWAVARHVSVCRLLTDHAIPSFLLSSDVTIDMTVLAPADAGKEPILGEVYTLTGSHTAHPSSSMAILYLHGGAFCCCSSRTHRGLLSQLTLLTGATIFAVDYRRPPEHPCPAGIEDTLRVYMHLVEAGRLTPERTLVAGDSAGGGLALAALVALRQRGGTPLPAAGMLLSPWCDLADTMSGSWREHHLTDYLPRHLATLFASAYAGNRPLHDPAVSPLHAELSGLPPLIIEAGGCEVLLDQIRRLAKKARAVQHFHFLASVPPLVLPHVPHAAALAPLSFPMRPNAHIRAPRIPRQASEAGVAVELNVAPEMVHVHQLFAFVADAQTPQPQQSMDRLAEFVRRVNRTQEMSVPEAQLGRLT